MPRLQAGHGETLEGVFLLRPAAARYGGDAGPSGLGAWPADAAEIQVQVRRVETQARWVCTFASFNAGQRGPALKAAPEAAYTHQHLAARMSTQAG